MFHIVYSKTDNDYTLMYATSTNHLLYRKGFGWYPCLFTLLNQSPLDATAFQLEADSSWLNSSIYSSPTFPTYEQLITTHPEFFI